MATFESSIRQIDYPQERVYALLSDMNNIDKVKDRIPEDKANGLTFDANSIGINTPMGAVKLVIVEREAPKCIKFETAESPPKFFVSPLTSNNITSHSPLFLSS